MTRRLLILGTRGIPAAHGGFETFAERLALYLVGRGWDVSVYCQDESGSGLREQMWNGVRQIMVPSSPGSLGSIMFDLRCVRDALRRPGRILQLGYNTAVFNSLFTVARRPFMVNMDGFEWARPKWSKPVKLWFRANEAVAALLGTTLIADHPVILSYMNRHYPWADTRQLVYGADEVHDPSVEPVTRFGLEPDRYFLTVCRIEPDNSILEIVRAFAARPRRGTLAVIGQLQPDENAYHREVAAAANDQVKFLGPVYQEQGIASLRYYARGYCHGHRYGGTNPSLVEALAARNVIIAHDNPFNRWTAGSSQFFFSSTEECVTRFDACDDEHLNLEPIRDASFARFLDGLTWEQVLQGYERLILEAKHADRSVDAIGEPSLQRIPAEHVSQRIRSEEPPAAIVRPQLRPGQRP